MTYKRGCFLDKWQAVLNVFPLDRIRSDEEYERVTAFMEEVFAEIGRKKKHPLCGLLDILELRLEEYDETQHPVDDVNGVEMLRFLMDQNGLRQQDLPELGNQGRVSEVLSGRRELNLRQIATLARRFKVAPEVFLPR